MFDTELCPLPFSLEEMFGFISCRFTGYPSSVQEQALLWLHVSALLTSHAETADNFEKEAAFPKLMHPFCPWLSCSIRMVGRQTLSVVDPS